MVIAICHEGKSRMTNVHTLVLESFVGFRPKGMQARHFPDNDTSNNRLSNLSWATPKVNQGDRVIHGTNNQGQYHARRR